MELRKLYGEMIKEFGAMLAVSSKKPVTCKVEAADFVWPAVENQLLLRADAALELGGGNLPAVSGMLYMGLSDFAGMEGAELCQGACGNRVVLCGPDLQELRGNVSYARVTIVGIREEFLGEEYKLYQLLRSIEYTRYHVNPKGYMPRISTVKSREQVRVSKEALARGLDFYKVGRSYGDACLAHPAVGAAETVFITEEAFDYRALQKLLDRAEAVTMSLDHPLNQLKMDCAACNLKPVCDEVELLCQKGRE